MGGATGCRVSHVRKGYIQIDFSTEPFDSAGHLIVRATSLFFSMLPFLASLTLLILVPAKLLVQFACSVLDVPSDGVLSFVVTDIGDLVFTSLLAPALIRGIVAQLQTGRAAPVGQSLRWGRRLWGKSLWNRFKVEITVALWSLLLVIPGIVAMMRLIFTDPIVAIEADRTTEVLQRSRELSAGRGWRIFLVLLPAAAIGVLHMYAGLRALQYSRWLMVVVDSVASVADQWMTVAAVLMYVGLVGETRKAALLH